MDNPKLNILIVDDDMVDREAVRRYLKTPGKDIVFHEASNGEAAAALMKDHSFDCIFLDYNMPDTDGISLLRRFYNVEMGLAPAPTVMLTGKGNESVMIDALRWGVQDYLVKDNISRDSLMIAMTKAKEMYELKKSQYQAAETLRQSQKMEAIGQLTSGIAHDFNNLLTIILGNTRMQKRILHDSGGVNIDIASFDKKIDSVESAARKGADLVKRLMIFTRQRPPEESTVNINDSVHETNELLRRTLGERIALKTIYAEIDLRVKIDAGQFENAVINIALNARDAMPTGGSLTIETQSVVVDDEYVFRHPDMSSGTYAMVSISDTGTGMPPEVMKRIFEPFYTTKQAGEGTGLGLSMVYGMLKQSGGYIHVYSEVGRGTIFRMYLPLVNASVPADPEEISDEQPAGGDETILIVDDDEKIRTVGAMILERLGYNTIQAESGLTALEILKHKHKNIGLLFTDVIMRGGMNGPQLAETARKYYPEIKVLYASGYSKSAMPSGLVFDENELIHKPYTKKELADRIRQILGEKEQKP